MDPTAFLVALFEAGFAHCRTVVTDQGGVLLSLATAGAIGGLLHCTGMCGPFVLSQVASRLERVPATRMSETTRWLGAALPGYHLGRLLTYATLGALSGGLAGGVSRLPFLAPLSSALMLLAAALFLLHALPRLPLSLPLPRRAWPATRWTQALLDAPTGSRSLALGILLGFLPCGLLYGALAAAAATGSMVGGFLAMTAFTLGTLPGLLMIGVVGHLASRRWRALIQRYAPGLLILNALALTFLALRS